MKKLLILLFLVPLAACNDDADTITVMNDDGIDFVAPANGNDDSDPNGDGNP